MQDAMLFSDQAVQDLDLVLGDKVASQKDCLFREAIPPFAAMLATSSTADLSWRGSLGRWADQWALRTLRSLTADDVGRYLSTLSAEHRDAGSLRQEKALLRTFFRWAVRQGWADRNPAADLDSTNPIAAGRRLVLWSEEQQQRLLLAASEKWSTPGQGTILPPRYLLPLVILALRTGLELGDLLALKWRHVDLDERVLRLPAGESSAGEDTVVPLGARAADCLQTLREEAHAAALATRRGAAENVLGLFHLPMTPSGVDRDAVERDFAEALKRAGLPAGHFLSLRLCFGRNCARAGVPLEEALALSTWEEPKLLEEIYLHSAPVEVAG